MNIFLSRPVRIHVQNNQNKSRDSPLLQAFFVLLRVDPILKHASPREASKETQRLVLLYIWQRLMKVFLCTLYCSESFPG